MTNTHEARQATVKTALDLGLQAWRTTESRERFIEAHDAVDALVADLVEARAQVERMREALLEARPYVYNVMQASDDWRSETAQDVLSRIDPALAAAVPDPEEDADAN